MICLWEYRTPAEDLPISDGCEVSSEIVMCNLTLYNSAKYNPINTPFGIF